MNHIQLLDATMRKTRFVQEDVEWFAEDLLGSEMTPELKCALESLRGGAEALVLAVNELMEGMGLA